MATQVQWRGGSTNEHNTFVGAAREITVDTDKQTLVVHDNSTAGGHPLLREDQDNLPSSVTNGLYTPGTNQVALATGGTGKLFIDANGKVGIATTDPKSKLDVIGTDVSYPGLKSADAPTTVVANAAANTYVRVAGGLYANASSVNLDLSVGQAKNANIQSGWRLKAKSSATVANPSGSDFQIIPTTLATTSATSLTEGSAALTILNTGNVGIGSTSPTGNLTVNNTTGNCVLEITRGAPGAGYGYQLTGASGATTPALRFTPMSNGVWGDEAMRLDASGNLGIGTQNPQQPLHIKNAGSSACRLVLENTGSSSVTSTQVWSQNDDLVFDTNGSDKVRITSDGKVGIGNQAPNYALDVTGSINAYNGFLRIAGTSSPSGNDPHIYRPGSSEMGFWAGGDERMRIDSSGNLLVGTTSSTSVGSSVGAKIQTRFSSSNVGISVVRENNTPIIALGRANGVVAQIVSDNQALGEIRFAGADGTDLESIAASITCEVDGTPGANDMPGRLVFSTNPGSPATGPTTRMELKADGRLYVQGVYDFTASASTVVVQPNGLIARSSSSIKYKTNVETIQDQYSDAILNVRPVWYQSLSELDNPDWGWWGFIAEEVAEIDPRLVHWKTVESVVQEDGSRVETPCDPAPEDVAYDRFVPHLLNLIKRQQQAIETLEAKVAALESA